MNQKSREEQDAEFQKLQGELKGMIEKQKTDFSVVEQAGAVVQQALCDEAARKCLASEFILPFTQNILNNRQYQQIDQFVLAYFKAVIDLLLVEDHVKMSEAFRFLNDSSKPFY